MRIFNVQRFKDTVSNCPTVTPLSTIAPPASDSVTLCRELEFSNQILKTKTGRDGSTYGKTRLYGLAPYSIGWVAMWRPLKISVRVGTNPTPLLHSCQARKYAGRC